MNIDIKSAENKLINVFNNIDDVCFYNSQKVIKAFWQSTLVKLILILRLDMDMVM